MVLRLRVVARWFRLYTRAAFGLHAPLHDPAQADCVVALAFGCRIDEHGRLVPGPCNDYLAARVHAVRADRPVIAQCEIDDALCAYGVGRGAEHVIRAARRAHQYLDTRECLMQMRSVMAANGWNTPAVVAHPHHLPRVLAVLAALGVDGIPVPGVQAIWDHRSGQCWTRGPVRWAVRESLAIAVYARRRWL